MSDMNLAEVMEQHPQLTTNGVKDVGSRGESRDVRNAEVAGRRAELAGREDKVYELVTWLRDNFRSI